MPQLFTEAAKRWAVLQYKRSLPSLWVLFVGGTGTGKSTIFNALCGRTLSASGIERPKTCGPVAYVHEKMLLETGFPFPGTGLKRVTLEAFQSSANQGSCGQPGELLIVTHGQEEWAHLVLIDTPDLDSLESQHRQMAEDLYLFSDVVAFVTSQEKYADGIPYKFFQNMLEDEKPHFFLLNKADQDMTIGEAATVFKDHGIEIEKKRFWLFPYLSSDPVAALPGEEPFKAFSQALFFLTAQEGSAQFLKEETVRKASALNNRLDGLLNITKQESQAAEQWLLELNRLFQRAGESFIKTQQERFSSQSRVYLQAQVRQLFSKYDLLARPRRALSRLFTPFFRLLVLEKKKEAPDFKEKALLKLREKVDLSPLRLARDQFNRQVLEKLSPRDPASALYQELRRPELLLTREEVEKRVWEEQDRMFVWLEETFQQLADGIPKTKEWGIYSTSIFWGVFILSIETAIGGGFGLLDAALDSFLAPLVTKGAVELFAYRELQTIARELTKRYQESLLSVLQEQRDRYIQGLQPLLIPKEAVKEIEALKRTVNQIMKK